MPAIIYRITNTINGKTYIGQTSRGLANCWGDHCRVASRGSSTYFHAAIRRYGKDAFVAEILESPGIEEVDDREIYWIQHARPEYNMALGGKTSRGVKQRPETNEKNRLARLGKKLTEEHKQKISNGLRGRPCSQETRNKIRDAQKGIPKKAESKEKMWLAHLGKKLGPHSPEHRAKISQSHLRRSQMKKDAAASIV